MLNRFTAKPDFVVTAVPWGVTPSLMVALVERGVPVLTETPPAPDLDGLRELWHKVGDSALRVGRAVPLPDQW
jgi:predicted dehydrogenase